MIKKPFETSLPPKLQADPVVVRRRPRRRDARGAVTITISPEALDSLLQVLAGGTANRSQATYDVHSPDLPMGKRRFRQGCKQGWWPSWRGPNQSFVALKADVDDWLRGGKSPSRPGGASRDLRGEALRILEKSGLG